MYINKNSMASSYKKYIIILIIIYGIIYSIQLGKELTSSKKGLMSAFDSKEDQKRKNLILILTLKNAILI